MGVMSVAAVADSQTTNPAGHKITTQVMEEAMEMVRDVAQGVAEEGGDEAMGTVEAMGSWMEAA